MFDQTAERIVPGHQHAQIDKGALVREMLRTKTGKDAVVAEACRRSFFRFVVEFWHEVAHDEPQWNWHVPFLCGELMYLAQTVAAGIPKQYDLLINIPPGTTKSTICSRMFPVWCWLTWYWMRFIVSSYAGNLALEHAQDSRDIVRSEKFRRLFPEFEIKQDKDTKSNFRITKRIYDDNGNFLYVTPGGNRYSTSVGGTLTGFHGHILLVDDPLDPNRAVSETELNTANRWIDQTLSTRKVNKEVTPTVLIMQRLHQNDPTGHIMAKKGKQIRHICLPGEIQNYKEEVNPPDLINMYQNGLLDPSRMSRKVLTDMEIDLGQYGYAGQVGQRPTPPGGGMFKVDHFQTIQQMPEPVNIVQTVRYWDKAGTEGGEGARTAGVKIHKLRNGKFLISDVKYGRWSTDERERVIRETAEADGPGVTIYYEQEPGSGGKESAEATARNLAGFSAYADRPTGDKVYRADPYSVQVNNGNVLLLQGEWNQEFKDEHRFFPFGTTKDMVDGGSGGFNKIAGKRRAGPLIR